MKYTDFFSFILLELFLYYLMVSEQINTWGFKKLIGTLRITF